MALQVPALSGQKDLLWFQKVEYTRKSVTFCYRLMWADAKSQGSLTSVG